MHPITYSQLQYAPVVKLQNNDVLQPTHTKEFSTKPHLTGPTLEECVESLKHTESLYTT
jgi:hypothetical protein